MPLTRAIEGHAVSTRRAIAFATAGIVAVGLIYRVVRYAANWPLWGDEAYLAVSLLMRDFAGLARPLEYYQIAPVGFLWAELAVVRLVGAGEWALRLLPFLSGLASLLLFWRFAATNLGHRATLMAVALFAASFYPVRHATEVKPYATDLFLSLVVTCLARALWKRPESRRAWAALTVVSTCGVWASYPLIFVSGGVGMVLAWRVRDRPTRWLVAAWIAFGGLTVASWAAMYLGFARPQALAAPFMTEMQTWEDSFPPLLRPWELPWWFLKTHTGNMMAYPYGGNNFGSLATALLVAYGGFVLWRRDRALLALLLSPLVPAFVAASLHRYPYGTSARIALFLAPAICLLAGQGLAALIVGSLPRRTARRVLLGLTAALGVAALAGAVAAVARPYMSRIDLEDRRVVLDLAARSRPGDRWIAFNGLLELPKVKQLMLMPWLQHLAEVHFYALRDAPGDLRWNPLPEDVAALPPPAGRTWFIVHNVGHDRFDAELVRAHLTTLNNLLGPPTIEQSNPMGGEAVGVFCYPAPVANPGGAGPVLGR